MKKNLTLLAACSFTLSMSAQFSLSKVAHEPTVGDVNITQEYDSVNVLPKSGGNNQVWNFSSLIQNTFSPTTSSFVAATGVPSASVFPGATLAEDLGNSDYNFYKSVSSPTPQFEFLGYYNTMPPAGGFKFTNGVINGIWPLASGVTFTDSFSGSNIGFPGTTTGTQTITSSGSGTLLLPGGVTHNNVVQVKTIRKSVTSITILTISVTYSSVATEYTYYHANQKFPLLTVAYDISDDGTTVDTSAIITMNKNVTLGVRSLNNPALSFKLYPNPAANVLHIEFTNSATESYRVEVFNSLGSMVLSKNKEDGNNLKETLDVSNLPKGLYVVNITTGDRVSTYKLIKE